MGETTFTYEQVQKLLESVVAKTQQLNPLEQKQYNETLELEKRKARAMVHFAKAEELARQRKLNGCTHSRYPNGHKLAGHPCKKGTGEWTTAGQVHGHGIASMICLRCSNIWIFRASLEEMQAIVDGALAGAAPPEEERCLTETCQYCNRVFTKVEFGNPAVHDIAACRAAYDREVSAAMVG